MRKRNSLIGIRNFGIIIIVALSILVIIDKVLPLLSFDNHSNEYHEGKNVCFMRYEKTQVESLLTVEEAKKQILQAGIDFSEYGSNKEREYPIVDDMPSTEYTDNRTVEITVFGDSFVYGDASLNRNELFWRQAEHMLRKKGYDCRVTAVAMAGATAYEEIKWYENYLKYNTPDLVVFGYVHNDALSNTSIAERKNGELDGLDYDIILPCLKPIKAVLPNIYARLTDYFDAKTMYSEKYGFRWRGTDISVLKDDLQEEYQAYFADKLDAIVKETKIPAVVMTLPSIPGNLTLKEFVKPLKEIFADTSVNYYNLTNDFDRYYSIKHRDNLFVNPDNPHPGSATHYFYATYLVNKLETDFRDVLGKKYDHSLQSQIININDCTPYQIDLQLISQSEHYAEYDFAYPTERSHSFLFYTIEPYWLTYPIDKSYIKLSFENPVDLTEIELSGVEADKAEIYFTKINKRLGYDDNHMYLIPAVEKDHELVGSIQNTEITSLCIHVDDDAVLNGKLKLKIIS